MTALTPGAGRPPSMIQHVRSRLALDLTTGRQASTASRRLCHAMPASVAALGVSRLPVEEVRCGPGQHVERHRVRGRLPRGQVVNAVRTGPRHARRRRRSGPPDEGRTARRPSAGPRRPDHVLQAHRHVLALARPMRPSSTARRPDVNPACPATQRTGRGTSGGGVPGPLTARRSVATATCWTPRYGDATVARRSSQHTRADSSSPVGKAEAAPDRSPRRPGTPPGRRRTAVR